MILFQVRDLAAKSCGEPHVAPSWEIAKASLGAMLAKTPELAERAQSILIESVGLFDPETGVKVQRARLTAHGEICLSEFLAACRREEEFKQEEADSPLEFLRKSADHVLKKQAEGETGQRLINAVSEFTNKEKQQIFEKQCEVSNIVDAVERRKK